MALVDCVLHHLDGAIAIIGEGVEATEPVGDARAVFGVVGSLGLEQRDRVVVSLR